MVMHCHSRSCTVYRLLLIFFLFTCLPVIRSQAQDTTTTKKVSLHYHNKPLKAALDGITAQTGLTAFYTSKKVNDQELITIDVHNVTLAVALQRLLSVIGYEWKIENGVIVINRAGAQRNNATDDASFDEGIPLIGNVSSPDGRGLEGATVEGAGKIVTTDYAGNFSITMVDTNNILRISYTGFATRYVRIKHASGVNVILEPAAIDLATVAVRSTGYQQIPPERATGSFDQIDNKLFNRRVGSTVIDRLEGVASGFMYPNREIPGNSTETMFSIRGRSTIFANTQPLIVVDNFPYVGDINQINPNDIDNITILKDAAAASIWGAFSGNGVIVITTKKGKLQQPLKVELNTNLTFGKKPNLFYNPAHLDSKDFIDMERSLFNQGYYDGDLSNTYTYPVISPVVELLDQARNGVISQIDADAQIEKFKNLDFRKDLSKYVYRSSLNQQYSLSLSGGSERNTYLFSMGYDRNKDNVVKDNYERVTMNNYNTFRLLKQLELSTGTTLTLTNSSYAIAPIQIAPSGGKTSYYPYAQLVNENGQAAALPRDYRYSYISTLGGNGEVTDWSYKPLDDINHEQNSTKAYHIRFNPNVRYTIIPGLDVMARYQFEEQLSTTDNYYDGESYYARNLYNLYTQVVDGIVTHPIPAGGILNRVNTTLTSHNFRGQVNLNKTFAEKHNIVAIAGIEQDERITENEGNTLYGYDKETRNSVPNIDYSTYFSTYQYLGTGGGYIENGDVDTRYNNEFISYFFNGAYKYNQRYLLTVSARIDQSNLFGVAANNKKVPLWSAGLGWDISREHFYKLDWLPSLKLRGTYGYNGNLDPTLYALFTIQYSPGAVNRSGLPYVNINSLPNSNLRWEKAGIFNIGLDFATKHDVISGTLEYYHKNGTDLIGIRPAAPQTGVNSLEDNYAKMTGNGVDLSLTTNNLRGKLQWVTNFLFSYNTDKVTHYLSDANLNQGKAENGDGARNSAIIPVLGKPVYSVYGYRWGGLDPTNGDPQGYVNGKLSKDYQSIFASTDPHDLTYFGHARPQLFGGLRNTFYYKAFSLSVNFTFKAGYYFRRNGILYSKLANYWTGGYNEYGRRWQQPGDEKHTNVPSVTFPPDPNRDEFYMYSGALIEKGDHIRFQDLRLDYTFPRLGAGIRELQLYCYANNLGIIWKANKAGLDPDYVQGYPAPRTIAIGCKASF
jgi:TonB-dependent starch-binding outer membrane protein SusC